MLLTPLAGEASQLFDGKSLEVIQVEEATKSLPKGSILIIGELHDNQAHHDNQLTMVKSLIKHFPKGSVHVGMEFLNYTDQWILYEYLNNNMTTENFLEAVKWSQPETFPFYSPFIDLIKKDGGNVLGLNIPRSITSKVAKEGLDALNKKDLFFLPPTLLLGNENYYERFYAAVGGGHVAEEKIQNYFWAQSIWDDVMSETALYFIEKNPEDILVIIVGDFHVAYGGGLKEIIERKGFSQVYSISQVSSKGLEEEQVQSLISPHPKYGARGDWVWLSK